MNRIMKRMIIVGLLVFAVVSYGCAGMNTGQEPSNYGWDFNGDRDSAYPPYHHPTH